MKKDIIIGVLTGSLIAAIIHHKRCVREVREAAIRGCCRAFEDSNWNKYFAQTSESKDE